MATTIKVVSVPSADTPGLCIHFHHERRQYIFGRVAEGTQRAYGSRKIGWGGIEHVFLSGPVGWPQMGGLLGMLLSIGGLIDTMKADREKQNLERVSQGIRPKALHRHKAIREAVDIHGGANLSHVLAASRHVIYRQPARLRIHETRDDPRVADPSNLKPDFEDDAIRVWKLPAQRARSSSPKKRRHDPAEDQFKPKHTLSDPELAALIVQNCMFTGKLAENTVLASRKLRDVKPEDLAVVLRDGTLERYTGPFATDGAEIENPDGLAYVFPKSGEEWPATGDQHDGIELRDIQLPRTAYSDNCMSYIVKCHDRRGKFNAPHAKSLGVDPKKFGILTSGGSVTLPDGSVVTPDMVLGEQQPGNGMIVADIPSVDFLDSFLDRPEWSNAELMKNIIIMYWSLSPGLAEDPRIQKFVQDHARIKHVFCAEDTCPNMITHPGMAEFQAKARQVDAERFPILHFDNRVKYPAPPAGSPIELGRAGSSLMLMPRVEFKDHTAAESPDLVSAANSLSPKVFAMARDAKQRARRPSFHAQIEEDEQDIPNRDTEIIALGTGSSVPSKYRNVSGTLIRVPGIGNYLLDCGEGTLGQIRRMYSPAEVKDILRNLRCIVISHLHADHHLGTTSLVTAWYEQALEEGRSSDTLAISCIGRFRQLLEEVSQIEDIGFHRLRFPNCPDPQGRDQLEVTLPADENFGLASVKRVRVPHCWGSHGTQLELTSGLRIAYSGDCRPSSTFAQAFHGAHLLVHECTFGDDMASHARAKSHSTMAEALGVAREMNARRTLLTHFSQRYVKGTMLSPNDDGAGSAGSVLMAFDFMKVRLGDFKKADCYMKAIAQLMKESEAEDPGERSS